MTTKITNTLKKERIALQEAIPLSTPFILYIEICGHCNFKCVFCMHSLTKIDGRGDVLSEEGLIKDTMSQTVLKKIIIDAAAFDDKMKLIRICGNGEPLLNKNAVEMCRLIHESDISERVELVTNGTLLNEKKSRGLVKYLDRIIISLEGLDSNDYTRYSQINLDYDKLYEDLRCLYNCSRDSNCVIHIKTHNQAVCSQDKRERFFKNFGNICDEISIDTLVNLWPEFDVEIATPDTFRYADSSNKMKKHECCVQMFKGLQIYANGDVVPCCVDWKRVNLLGNIQKDTLREIWNGEKLMNLQLTHLRKQKNSLRPCKDCIMNDVADVDFIDEDADTLLKKILG